MRRAPQRGRAARGRVRRCRQQAVEEAGSPVSWMLPATCAPVRLLGTGIVCYQSKKRPALHTSNQRRRQAAKSGTTRSGRWWHKLTA